MKTIIVVKTLVDSSLEKVWKAWTDPKHIVCWNFASETWKCPEAKNDLRQDGEFSYRMEAVDGSAGFDFKGRYIEVIEQKSISYAIEDGRKVKVLFEKDDTSIRITESFEAEDIHTHDQQKEGWQSILNNFKKHVESL